MRLPLLDYGNMLSDRLGRPGLAYKALSTVFDPAKPRLPVVHTYVQWYHEDKVFDPARRMLELAKERLPEAQAEMTESLEEIAGHQATYRAFIEEERAQFEDLFRALEHAARRQTRPQRESFVFMVNG